MDVVALHMSDGLIDARACALLFAVAVLGSGIAAWRARSDIDARSAPTAALVAAVVFAVQLVAVPVAPGVSGHLVGAALAAIWLGPFAGALVVATVVVVQAFVFADGGLSTLGANVATLALTGAAAGYGTAVAVLRLRDTGRLPARFGPGAAGFAAGFVSIVAVTAAIVVEYALGGPVTVPVSTIGVLFALQIPVAIGEGILTAAVVTIVGRRHPDSVHPIRTRPEALRARGRPKTRLNIAVAALALGVAGVIGPLGSDAPDTLAVVAARGCESGPGASPGHCMGVEVREHRLDGGAFAGYTMGGQPGSAGVTGVLGAAGCFVVVAVVLRMLLPRSRFTSTSRSRTTPGTTRR